MPLGDAAYGDITEFRCGLEERGLSYLLDIQGKTSAYNEEVQLERPEWTGNGRPPKARYREDPPRSSNWRSLPARTPRSRSPGTRARAGR